MVSKAQREAIVLVLGTNPIYGHSEVAKTGRLYFDDPEKFT